LKVSIGNRGQNNVSYKGNKKYTGTANLPTNETKTLYYTNLIASNNICPENTKFFYADVV